jgi:hypothetical protein
MGFVSYQYRKSPFDDLSAMSQPGGVNERMERDGDGVCRRDSLVNVSAIYAWTAVERRFFVFFFSFCVDFLIV